VVLQKRRPSFQFYRLLLSGGRHCHNMEHSSERGLQLWDEKLRSNELRKKADGRQWRRRFFLYLGVIVATIAIATLFANLSH
jgi:hypothetical protein